MASGLPAVKVDGPTTAAGPPLVPATGAATKASAREDTGNPGDWRGTLFGILLATILGPALIAFLQYRWKVHLDAKQDALQTRLSLANERLQERLRELETRLAGPLTARQRFVSERFRLVAEFTSTAYKALFALVGHHTLNGVTGAPVLAPHVDALINLVGQTRVFVPEVSKFASTATKDIMAAVSDFQKFDAAHVSVQAYADEARTLIQRELDLPPLSPAGDDPVELERQRGH